VLLKEHKSIPKGADQKTVERIERKNQRIDRANNFKLNDVAQKLNLAYNGSDGRGSKNSAGETVKFKFNVIGHKSGDTKGGSDADLRNIAIQYSLGTSVSAFEGAEKTRALAAVVTDRSTKGDHGLSNGVWVAVAANAPETALAHEIGHTLKLADNFPKSTGGIMDYPPGSLIPKEVDQIWNSSYEK
jgi:hypothetical protein